MKVGILTLPFNNNYGGYLQSYALSQVLKSLGHHVTLINRRPSHVRYFSVKYAVKQILKFLLFGECYGLVYDSEKIFESKGRNILPFMNNAYDEITKPYFDSSSMESDCKDKFDAVIVGSDQIWRPDYVENIEDFFLTFLHNPQTLKIAYAASFGGDQPIFSRRQKDICGRAICSFTAVSLREKSGVRVIHDLGWNLDKVQFVLDPTMLLSVDYYRSLTSKSCHVTEQISSYVFQYLLDDSEEKVRMINHIARYSKCEVRHSVTASHRRCLSSLEEWLSSIQRSFFVVTDSFHGTVFAILFNRPFAVIQNQTRGNARISSVLETFGLLDRMVSCSDDYMAVVDKKINWHKVNHLLLKYRSDSIQFLKDALEC